KEFACAPEESMLNLWVTCAEIGAQRQRPRHEAAIQDREPRMRSLLVRFTAFARAMTGREKSDHAATTAARRRCASCMSRRFVKDSFMIGDPSSSVLREGIDAVWSEAQPEGEVQAGKSDLDRSKGRIKRRSRIAQRGSKN